MAWLEGSFLGHAMRESGVWTYGVVNLFHILGIASLFGSVLILDLRLSGCWRTIRLAAVTEPSVRVAEAGFTLAVLSGICLLATKATEYVDNPFIYIKFPVIALALVNVAILRRLPSWRGHKTRDLSIDEQSTLAIFGRISLACWLTAITAGRMIGYW